jgi:hypothetical protein
MWIKGLKSQKILHSIFISHFIFSTRTDIFQIIDKFFYTFDSKILNFIFYLNHIQNKLLPFISMIILLV